MPLSELFYNEDQIYKSEVDLIRTSVLWRTTSFLRGTPDFFIGGVQKGGTTSLYHALMQHPQIIQAKNKELFYYGTTPNYEKGIGFYKQFFATSTYKKQREREIGKQTFSIDASTNTIDSKEAPSRILKDNPNAKIIFILRNPTERAYSHYKMNVKLGWELTDFEKALELESKRIEEGAKRNPKHNYAYQRLGYRSRGLYINNLKHWYSNFPKENIFVTSSNEFFANPTHVFNLMCEFLGIETDVKIIFEKQNEGSTEKMDPKTEQELNAYFKPYNDELFRFLNKKLDW